MYTGCLFIYLFFLSAKPVACRYFYHHFPWFNVFFFLLHPENLKSFSVFGSGDHILEFGEFLFYPPFPIDPCVCFLSKSAFIYLVSSSLQITVFIPFFSSFFAFPSSEPFFVVVSHQSKKSICLHSFLMRISYPSPFSVKCNKSDLSFEKERERGKNIAYLTLDCVIRAFSFTRTDLCPSH